MSSANDSRIFLVKFLKAYQAVQDGGHLWAIGLTDFLKGMLAAGNAGVENNGQNAVALQSFLLNGYQGSLQAHDHGVKAKHVALDFALAQRRFQELADAFPVVVREKSRSVLPQFPE